MQVVKYFHEEPASLEVLAPDTSPLARAPAEPASLEAFLRGPRYYRGYLAGTDLATNATGASTVMGAWLESFVSLIGEDTVHRQRQGFMARVDVRQALTDARPDDVLTVGLQDQPGALPEGPLRERLAPIRRRLDAGAAVLVAEPAPDGVDWAVFRAEPMADAVRALFAGADKGPARFVIPHVKARGEHRFYFERYDLDLYAEYRV